MKRMLITLLAGMTIAALSYGVGVGVAQRTSVPALANLQDAAWLKQHLGVTDSQAETLDALQMEFGAQLVALCEQHCAARNELAAQLLRADWSADAEQELLERMGRAQIQTDAVTLEHIRRVSRVLTPAQRARYQQHVAARMHASCPHQLHHGSLAHGGATH